MKYSLTLIILLCFCFLSCISDSNLRTSNLGNAKILFKYLDFIKGIDEWEQNQYIREDVRKVIGRYNEFESSYSRLRLSAYSLYSGYASNLISGVNSELKEFIYMFGNDLWPRHLTFTKDVTVANYKAKMKEANEFLKKIKSQYPRYTQQVNTVITKCEKVEADHLKSGDFLTYYIKFLKGETEAIHMHLMSIISYSEMTK